ncbi:hypothetical protein PPUN15366_05890 [Pseudomonas putida]|uniref:hypothetical protein n=1 Tax=Pseudomonas putida TaxID=303 RepID=UPI00235D0815|nr:hypothetical protein [Pseudomonas putida]GLO38945.1 hypothetical protein PPUN15366_05890 [Pseudomonas putida]HDS0974504.1 hypothetical protein [Pseudomonas putida]
MARGSHMKDRYGDKEGSFSAQLQQFAEAAKEAMELTFRQVVFLVGKRLVTMSPVGNPDKWKINVQSQEKAGAQVDAYNAKAAAINAAIADEPSNFTKSGNLKRGIKYRKPLTKREQLENYGYGAGVRRVGQGYVGGRFRSNWQLTASVPASGEIDEIEDASETIAKIAAAAGELTLGEVAYIVNNLPYAVPLEYGHSTQAPEGMVRITIRQFQELVENAAKGNQV